MSLIDEGLNTVTSSEKSWFDSAVENLSTGGKYHKIWEGVEDIGRFYRDKENINLDEGENLSNINKTAFEIKSEEQEKFNIAKIKSYFKNPLVIGGSILAVLATLSIVRK